MKIDNLNKGIYGLSFSEYISKRKHHQLLEQKFAVSFVDLFGSSSNKQYCHLEYRLGDSSRNMVYQCVNVDCLTAVSLTDTYKCRIKKNIWVYYSGDYGFLVNKARKTLDA